MVMKCGYTRKIDFDEYYEAECDINSDFSKRYKFDDFRFVVSPELNPRSCPGDVLITQGTCGSIIITFDMISNRRKQFVPDCIKDEVAYFANNMLEENLLDIKEVLFFLYAKIEFSMIGTYSKNFMVNIIMIDRRGNQLQEEHFSLYDYEDAMEDAMEEYFKNELFPAKAVSQV